MIDMLHYLQHQRSAAGETRLLVVASRHEDGSWGDSSMEYHRQRGRSLKSLTQLPGCGAIEFSDEIDADYSCETGQAWIDMPVAAAGFSSSLAALIASWLSMRPRRKKDSVPGVRLECNGASLVIPAEMEDIASEHLIDAFLTAARQGDGQQMIPPEGDHPKTPP